MSYYLAGNYVAALFAVYYFGCGKIRWLMKKYAFMVTKSSERRPARMH